MVKFFKILFQKFSPPHRSTLLCSNVIKFVRREIGEIVRYLPDKKKQNFGCLSFVITVQIAPKNLPDPVRNNVITMLQISSKMVHFRRSYSRTRENRFLPHRVFTRYRLFELI